MFHCFASFRKVLEIFGRVQKRSDAFGCLVAEQKKQKSETKGFKIICISIRLLQSYVQIELATPRPTHRKKWKKSSASQTIDQVIAIKTHSGSSKSGLSSRGRRPFKVFCFAHLFKPLAVHTMLA